MGKNTKPIELLPDVKIVGSAGEDISRGDYLMIDPQTKLVVRCGVDIFGRVYRIRK